MFPSHCKEVSVKSVDFELTEENIKGFFSGKRSYIRTRFYVFNSGNDWAVALVVKKGKIGILQDIASVHVLSLPKDTSFVDDPSLEVLSGSAMGRLRESKGTKCVVVRGRSEHVSFFIEEMPYDLTIFDVVPPEPSKLVGLVDSALESDLQDRYVRVRTVTSDLNDFAKSTSTEIVMFPCRASGLKAEARVMYLDETPTLSEEDVGKVTLIGCSLSARIFKAIYGREVPRLVNMCPKDLVNGMGISGPVLVKCCKVKEGFEVSGSLGIVPWGARSNEVADALRAILR
ncbi:MAG: hypothetical protein JW880_07840 [Candidatus Thermoplasmatota archaeon]|nr:hypothetical protein [Candidatus Thermoplasmatota archaeon]